MGRCKLLTLTILVAAVAAVMAAQPPASAPSPKPDCETPIVTNLAMCLDYVMEGSNATKPVKDCCDGLSTLVNTQPVCLCELLSNSSLTDGLNVSRSRSLRLPAACQVKTPPLSACNAAGYPVTDLSPSPAPPVPSPDGSPTTSPEFAPGPSGQSSVCEDLAINKLVMCLDYVMNGANQTKPPKDCCTGFASIIETKPLCLCDLVANNSTFATEFSVNQTKALTLPDVCNVATPNVTLCSALGYQVGGPGTAPAPPGDKCTGVVANKLEPCIAYVQKGGNATLPSQQCCSGYSSLLASDSDCVCTLLGNSSTVLPGFDLDIERAIMLPNKCKAKIPICGSGPTSSPPSRPAPPTASAGFQGYVSRFKMGLFTSITMGFLLL